MTRPLNSRQPRQGDSLGSFAVSLIQSLGGQPTPQATKFFRAWQQREGGMTANAASWNPLNLTAPGSGLPTINSVGVVAMPNMQAGVQRTAKLLRSGYPALAEALRTGRVDLSNPAVQADLNRWVSGQRTPGASKYVQGIASAYGSALPMPTQAGPPMVTGASSPRQTTKVTFGPPQLDQALFGRKVANAFATGGGRVDLTKLANLQAQSFFRPKTVTRTMTPYGPTDQGGTVTDPGGGNSVTQIAGTQIGKPYVFGSGPDTKSFDCSDLIQWSYRQLGINLPRTTFEQVKVGTPIKDESQLKPGDLVFPSPHHVVMYVGNGKVIAAPHTGTVVQYQDLAAFGKPYAIRRILR